MASRQNLVAAALALLPLVHAQNPAAASPYNPTLTTWKCTTAGGCVQQDTSVAMDWNYHWIHTVNGYNSCTTSSGVDPSLCPDAATCAKNCVIEPVNYADSGVITDGDSLTMYQYVKRDGQYENASPRLYLLGSDRNYVMMQLLNQELTFDVDLSTLPCGENGALYLSEMSASGGRNQYNTGGAEYGSGYCDGQCPVQTWKNGTLNTNGSGYCCSEMDILEGNSRANSYTPHACNSNSCDSPGCGFNPYAVGQQSYWGPGGTVDTSRPFTVTTQFLSSDGTAHGTLKEIRRQYIQDGRVIANAKSSSGLDSITKDSCTSAANYGGLTSMGKALGRGMVLTFSIWNDDAQFMNWLDSGSNGPCSSTEGNPALIKAQNPTTHITFSKIHWGDIGSTFSGSGGSSSSATKTTTKASTQTTTKVSTTTVAGGTQTHWGQCGGEGWTGPTVCESPYTCQAQNTWYSQCL